MTDYAIQATPNYSARDGLASGNANKAITGALFQTEFEAISTAIATKMDDIDQFATTTNLENADLVAIHDDSGGDNSAITWANTKSYMPVIQTAYGELDTVQTTTATIAFDDTIPQISEGFEVVTVSITPKSTSNYLVITADFMGATSSGNTVSMALFNSDTHATNAIQVRSFNAAVNELFSLHSTVRIAAPVTGSTTIAMRVGNAASGTLTVNGQSGSRYFGGAARCTLTVQEVLA